MTTAAPTKKPASVEAPVPAPAEQTPAAASTGLSITALVLGITGIALGQGLLSIGGIIFGFVARTREPAGRLTANWGLVLGFVGLFGGLILGIIGFAAFAPLWVGFGAWDMWGWAF